MKLGSSSTDTSFQRRTSGADSRKAAVRLGADTEEKDMNLYVLKTWIEAKLNVTDERGASMVEYGLLLALIAVIAIVAVKALGTGVSEKFSEVNSNLG